MLTKSSLAARLCLQAVRQNGAARLSTTAPKGVKYAPVPKTLVERMKDFQIPNGLPVHIKGGWVDRILYVATATICTVGLLDCCHVIYVLSYPQKRD